MNKYKKGDTVIVISGKDRGKKGEVKSVNPSKQQLIVAGVNLQSNFQKKTEASDGGIHLVEGPIAWSKVKVLSGSKPTRVAFKTQNGKKERIAVATGDKI